MNRKLIAVAVGAVLGLPAVAAAQSTVQIYGRAHVEYAFTKQGGANEDQLHNGGGSNIGFRGTEALGGGLNAWFQCESSMQTQTGTNADGFCSRNSGVGFQGGFGNVMFGHWDLPMKWATVAGVKNADTGVFGVANLFHKGAPAGVANGTWAGAGQNVVSIVTTPQAGATAGTATGTGTVRSTSGVNQAITTFYRRQANTVQYWTPRFGGFEARVAMSSANEEGAPPSRTPRTWGLAGKYTAGPLLVSLGYEKHKEYLLTGRDDTGWIAAVSYQLGPVRLAAMYEDLEYESFHATNTAETDTWGLFADWNISGPHSLRFQFVKADDFKGAHVGTQATGAGTTLVFNAGAGGTGAKQYGVQYSYDFSKRTAVRVAYSVVDNDSNARYGLYVTGPVGAAAGDRARGWGVAIDHRF
ncbi:MAG: porin [Burkholderiales bacterium]|nr:porin [Burkholderiales bacterium]